MLVVIFPVAFKATSFAIGVHTEAISLVIHPVAIIDVTVNMKESTIATRLIKLPVALVPCLVCPEHGALAVA